MTIRQQVCDIGINRSNTIILIDPMQVLQARFFNNLGQYIAGVLQL